MKECTHIVLAWKITPQVFRVGKRSGRRQRPRCTASMARRWEGGSHRNGILIIKTATLEWVNILWQFLQLRFEILSQTSILISLGCWINKSEVHWSTINCESDKQHVIIYSYLVLVVNATVFSLIVSLPPFPPLRIFISLACISSRTAPFGGFFSIFTWDQQG